jgi:signal transduction histidine kinase
MPIDYRSLVEGLSHVTALAREGVAELVAIDALVATAYETSEAVGATYTEYGEDGGRVVVAHGAMTWSLGQPIGAEFVEPDGVGQAWAGRVDMLPNPVAEPLLRRGVLAMAGQPVRANGRVVGAVHLYFGELDEETWPQAEGLLQVVGACAAQVHASGVTAPAWSAVEEDDRDLFLAVAGHELRTPVTVIKGYASLLNDRWDELEEPDRRAAAAVLAQRADDLAQLVDRLLGATAGDSSGGWLVRTVPFDPLDALLKAAAEMPAELRRALRLELPNRLPPASGDPVILGSVVTELVVNAVRATPGDVGPAPSSVDVTAGADADSVFIRVCDRGVGIDPADAERAFDRFWRDRHVHDARGGVGLGLYLVRRLVERQNGWVSLRPRDGGGTIAEVRLTRADNRLRSATGEE